MSRATQQKNEFVDCRRWEPARFEETRSAGAAAFTLPTVSDLERLREAAQREGFETGYAQAGSRIEAEAARFAALLSAARRECQAAEAAAAAQLIDLAVAIARTVVRRTLEIDPGHIGEVVRHAVQELPLFGTRGRVLLHPEDAALTRAAAGAELEQSGWQIQDDARLRRGDCRLDTGAAQLDATLETRWSRALAALGRKEPWEPRETTDGTAVADS